MVPSSRFIIDYKFQGAQERLILWPSGLGKYTACKRFAVQTLLWSAEIFIHKKSQVQHHLLFET